MNPFPEVSPVVLQERRYPLPSYSLLGSWLGVSDRKQISKREACFKFYVTWEHSYGNKDKVVKPECFYTRFDEGQKVAVNVIGQKDMN